LCGSVKLSNNQEVNLKNFIFSLGDDIVSKPMKKYIAFIRKTNFIDIVLRTSSDSKILYVDVTSTNKVVVINTENMEIIDQVKTGKTPFWITVSNNS